jgi:hypothetical protein
MDSMRLAAMCHYSSVLVALSVLLAIAGSWLGLGLAFFFRDEAPGRWRRKISSALLMGAAIFSMHYTAMAAASFTPSAIPPDLSHAVSVSALGIAGISGVPALVLVVTLLTSMVDRLQTQRALLDELFEQAPSAVALLNHTLFIIFVGGRFERPTHPARTRRNSRCAPCGSQPTTLLNSIRCNLAVRSLKANVVETVANVSSRFNTLDF